MLVANSSVTGMVNMTAEGMVSGWVPPEYNYTAYDYDDCIGVSTSVSIQLLEDQTTPEIGVPARTPDVDVQPYQDVRISVNITDAGSGVQNATLHYTTDNGTTWENVTMTFNQTASVYEATIPGQQAGIWVRFKISSLDCLDNEAVLDGVEPYCMYQVVPEVSSYPMLLLMLCTIAAAVVLVRKLLARQKF
jgi:hypothetical protein